jgi:hypothetical protein
MKNSEEKLGGYTATEWIDMIEDGVVAEISNEVSAFIAPLVNNKLNQMENKLMPPPPPSNELVIFSQEQLNILPQEAKDSVISLEKNLPQKELLILNPLVSELLKVKELAKLKYEPLPEEPTKEDIEKHNINIQEFKDAKKSITALKQQNESAKTAIKKPLDTLGKQVLTFEKSVNTIAVDVLTTLEKTFKIWIDAEAAKAKAKADAKTEKANAAINALSEQNQAQANTFKKSTLITFLKYEMLGPLKLEVNGAIENYSLDKLFVLRDGLVLRTFESFTAEKELNLLDDEELTNIKKFFSDEIDLFRKSINTKIEALELAKTNEKLVDTVETQAEQLSTPPPPPPLGTSPIANTNVFEQINDKSGVPYGQGANQNTVPVDIFPKNPNDVDFLDLVIDQINSCRDNVKYIRDRFVTTTEIVKSEDDLVNITRVGGSLHLLDKTIAYILGQLPPKDGTTK